MADGVRQARDEDVRTMDEVLGLARTLLGRLELLPHAMDCLGAPGQEALLTVRASTEGVVETLGRITQEVTEDAETPLQCHDCQGEITSYITTQPDRCEPCGEAHEDRERIRAMADMAAAHADDWRAQRKDEPGRVSPHDTLVPWGLQ